MRFTLSYLNTKNLRVPDFKLSFKKGMNFLQIPNGTGKTTLLSLIRLTLSNDWDSVSEKEIRAFKRKGGDANDGHFEIGYQFNRENYAFLVNFDFDNGKVSIDTDTPQGRNRDSFSPPRELRPFLTKNHVNIFNFSAQIANTHFSDDSAAVRNAVGTFSGRLNLEKLEAELLKKFKAKHRGSTHASATESLEGRLNALDNKIQSIKDLIKTIEKGKEKVKDKWDIYDQRVNAQSDQVTIFQTNRRKTEASIEELKPIIADYENEIEKLAASPINMSERFKGMVEDVFSNLEQAKLPGIANLFFDEIAEQKNCICGTKMTPELKKTILDRKANYLDTDDVGFINEMKSHIKEAIPNVQKEHLEDIVKKAESKKLELQDFIDELADIDREMAQNILSPKEMKDYDELGDQIKEFDSKLAELKKSDYEGEKNHIEKERGLLKLTESQINNLIKNLPDAQWLHLKLTDKHAAASGYQQANKNMEMVQKLINEAIENAENNIKEQLVISMNEMIANIHADQEFKVSSIDKAIHLDGQQRGSGAQEVITVSTFALSLLNRSSVDFPMIIDHPVKDIQNEDRASLSKFLNESTHQCICLVINSEKDGFIRDDESRELHSYLERSNFITAVRSRNAPDFPEDKIETEDGLISHDYKFFNGFRTAQMEATDV